MVIVVVIHEPTSSCPLRVCMYVHSRPRLCALLSLWPADALSNACGDTLYVCLPSDTARPLRGPSGRIAACLPASSPWPSCSSWVPSVCAFVCVCVRHLPSLSPSPPPLPPSTHASPPPYTRKTVVAITRPKLGGAHTLEPIWPIASCSLTPPVPSPRLPAWPPACCSAPPPRPRCPAATASPARRPPGRPPSPPAAAGSATPWDATRSSTGRVSKRALPLLSSVVIGDGVACMASWLAG